MLIQFNFRNYKSYRDATSLDMTATTIKEHDYNLTTNLKGERCIKVAAIYGANASGKTAAIDAFDLMRHIVINSFKRENEGKGIPLKRFAFDKSSKDGQSEFEVFFSHKDMEFQYGFSADNKKVHKEWLYKRDFRSKTKFITLFERDLNKIQCGKSLAGADKFVDLVEESTLFLSLISNTKIKETKEVYNWFLNTEIMDFGNVVFEEFYSKFLPIKDYKNEQSKNNLEEYLKAIDVGIDGIRIEKIKDIMNNEGKSKYHVYSKHRSLHNGYVEIPFEEESSGTQKMFALYRSLVDCLTQGSVLFVDELDAKLHPLLLRYVINMFHNPEVNKRNAQLIYTTHDIYTLTRDTFRRDQIWFAEKDNKGISTLYSLAEYKKDDKKIRNDATYNKDYLLGRYGAVPLLKEFKIV